MDLLWLAKSFSKDWDHCVTSSAESLRWQEKEKTLGKKPSSFICMFKGDGFYNYSILGICTRYLLNLWLSHNLRPWRQAHVGKK